jgi:hypothetical protein
MVERASELRDAGIAICHVDPALEQVVVEEVRGFGVGVSFGAEFLVEALGIANRDGDHVRGGKYVLIGTVGGDAARGTQLPEKDHAGPSKD